MGSSYINSLSIELGLSFFALLGAKIQQTPVEVNALYLIYKAQGASGVSVRAGFGVARSWCLLGSGCC